MAGSSATKITIPPPTPVYDRVKSGSAATFKPTCFIAQALLAPLSDAPKATSVATFSLGAHSQ